MSELKELSLRTSHSYLRDFFNKKLRSNMSGLIDSISPFSSAEVKTPEKKDLSLTAADSLVASGLKKLTLKVESNVDSAALQASITNQPLIFRIHRDILYTNMSHKDRLLAGIKQQLRKGYCNKKYKEVYL